MMEARGGRGFGGRHKSNLEPYGESGKCYRDKRQNPPQEIIDYDQSLIALHPLTWEVRSVFESIHFLQQKTQFL